MVNVIISLIFQNVHIKTKVKEAEKEIIAIGQTQVSSFQKI